MRRPSLIRRSPSKRLHTGLVGRPPEPDEIQPVTESTAEIKPESTGGLAYLAEIHHVLAEGGLVRFHWGHGQHILVNANGKSFTPIDGRSYQGFLKTANKRYTRTETGSTDTKDLVIEWRKQ